MSTKFEEAMKEHMYHGGACSYP